MPLIAFVRHGEADNNVKRMLVGRHIESHLTERGIQQVKDTGQHLKKLKIDRVYVSPVTRAIETAKIICEINDLQYQTDGRLYEIELGDLVGMNYHDVIEKHGNLFLKFYSGDDPILDSYGIESFSAVKKRIKNLLDESMKNYPDKNLLFVTHLDPIKAAVSIMLGLPPESLYGWHIRNASMTILKHESGILSLSGVNVMGFHRYNDE
ncbi:MAG: histidine phosphatase family protein [Nitrososphaeraceae archaeon]|nr:histidine phosphatase family protein [Nitrososphaeraceae archaeon]